MRRPLIWLAAAMVLASQPYAVAGQRSESLSSDQAPWVASEPYSLPFETREEWLEFIRGTDGGQDAASAYVSAYPADLYDRALTGSTANISRISYLSDNLLIRGFMVTPNTPGPHPVVVFNHGGVMQWGRIPLPDILEFVRLAERGYIVLASAYRGEGGSEGKASMDGGATRDVLTLVDLIDRIPEADPERIGMWGSSRGGLVTYDVLTRTDKVNAAIVVAGPTDLASAPRRAEFDEHVYPYVIEDYANDKDAALARLSPINWVSRLSGNTPILLLHGTNDERVETGDTLRMAAELQRLGHPYQLKIYKGGDHLLLSDLNDVRGEIDRWLDLHLREAGAARPDRSKESQP